MYTIFDAHAHIYPEKIAVKAAHAIGDFYDIPMKYDGTVEHLLALRVVERLDCGKQVTNPLVRAVRHRQAFPHVVKLSHR